MHCSPRHTPSTGSAVLAEVPDRLVRQAGVARDGPGRARSSTASGSSALHLVEGDRVVAVHDRLGAQLTEVLHEVVDERVVVVDHEHPRHGPSSVAVRWYRAMPQSKSSARATRRRPRRRRRRQPARGSGVAITTLLVCGLLVVVTELPRTCCPGRHREPLPAARHRADQRRVHDGRPNIPVNGNADTRVTESQRCDSPQTCPQPVGNRSLDRGDQAPSARGSGGAASGTSPSGAAYSTSWAPHTMHGSGSRRLRAATSLGSGGGSDFEKLRDHPRADQVEHDRRGDRDARSSAPARARGA